MDQASKRLFDAPWFLGLNGDGQSVAQASSPAGFGGVPPPEAEE